MKTSSTQSSSFNYSHDARSNDLYNWQARLITLNAALAAQTLIERKYRFVSSGVVAISSSEMDAQRALSRATLTAMQCG
jgi:hypothetical protein